MKELTKEDVQIINEIIQPVLLSGYYINIPIKNSKVKNCFSIYNKQGKNLTKSEIDTLAYYIRELVIAFNKISYSGPILKNKRDEYVRVLNKLRS